MGSARTHTLLLPQSCVKQTIAYLNPMEIHHIVAHEGSITSRDCTAGSVMLHLMSAYLQNIIRDALIGAELGLSPFRNGRTTRDCRATTCRVRAFGPQVIGFCRHNGTTAIDGIQNVLLVVQLQSRHPHLRVPQSAAPRRIIQGGRALAVHGSISGKRGAIGYPKYLLSDHHTTWFEHCKSLSC